MRSCDRSMRPRSPMSFFAAIRSSLRITRAWRARAGQKRWTPTRRRNSPNAGGCDFRRTVDNTKGVIWAPYALPTVVTLTQTPEDLADPRLVLGAHSLRSILTIDQDDQIVELRGACLRVYKAGNVGGSAAVLLPLDRLFEIRTAAALRLWRALAGRRPGPDLGTLTPDRRNRLILALRALDGRLSGASYPEIAAILFDAAPISKRDWISHELRDQTGRIVRLGFSMMRGGYRRLLLHPYRRRV